MRLFVLFFLICNCVVGGYKIKFLASFKSLASTNQKFSFKGKTFNIGKINYYEEVIKLKEEAIKNLEISKNAVIQSKDEIIKLLEYLKQK